MKYSKPSAESRREEARSAGISRFRRAFAPERSTRAAETHCTPPQGAVAAFRPMLTVLEAFQVA